MTMTRCSISGYRSWMIWFAFWKTRTCGMYSCFELSPLASKMAVVFPTYLPLTRVRIRIVRRLSPRKNSIVLI